MIFRKLLVLAALLGAALGAPAGARAGGLCGILTDRSGDVAGAANVPRPTTYGEVQRFGDAIDITRLDVGIVGDDIALEIGVVDLGGAEPLGASRATYTASWRAGDLTYYVRATRVSARWTFRRGATVGSDVSGTGGEPARGRIDAASSTVRLLMPRSVLPEGESLLRELGVSTAEESDWLGHVARDAAGGMPGGPMFRLGTGCFLSASARRCTVSTDPPDDPGPVAGAESPRPATDIRAIRMGVNATTLVVEFRVASLRADVPEGEDVESWWVSWRSPDGGFGAGAMRGRDWIEYTYSTNGAYASNWTVGSLDRERGTITVLVPRAAVRAWQRSRLTEIHGSSNTGTVSQQGDSSYGGGVAYNRYVVGVACSSQRWAAYH